MTIPARHDSLFKFTFSTAEHAASAIKAVLPPNIRRHIDFDTFELQPGSFVDTELRGRHTDLLYRTRLHGGGELLVHILFEHQSTPDATMPLRMLSYMVRIWFAALREAPDSSLLPIIPVVLYHGNRPWTAPQSMAEMYSADVRLDDFRELLPTARFIVDDLTGVSDDALRARALTGMAEVTLGTLKHIHDGQAVVANLFKSFEALVEVWRAPNGLRAIEALTRYILTNNDVAEQTMGETLGQLLGDEAQKVAMTTAQRLFSEGEELGLKRGRKEGREEGREEGLEQGREAERRLAARTLLTRRFGVLTDEALERFEALDLDALAVIYDEIFTAESLDALLTQAKGASGEAR